MAKNGARFNPFTPSAEQFTAALSKTGVEFADAMRFYLPQAAFKHSQASRAEASIKKAARTASTKITSASRAFLSSGVIRDAVIEGQRKATASLGLTFGGPNDKLIAKLTHELAGDLGKAAQSPHALASKMLRETTAIAHKIEDGIKYKLLKGDPSTEMTQSLLGSTMDQKTYKQATEALIDKLGLKGSDQVLFLSGVEMNAEVYAKLVVRTRTMEALNQGKAAEYVDQGYLYIETSQHDGVDPKDICYELQGRVWALAEGNPEGLPVLPEEWGLPPWHPNCAHTFGAWQPKFEGGQSAVDSAIEDHADDSESLAKWTGDDGRARAYQPASKDPAE